jgi:hypothetical protein
MEDPEMTVVSRNIQINAPADKVFTYLADIERHVEWSGELSFGLEKIQKVTPGPLTIGTVFKSLGQLSSRAGVEDTSTVTEFKQDSHLAWETVSDGAGQQNIYRWAYKLEPRGDGTKLTYSLMERHFSPKPLPLWFPPLLWLVDRKVFAREMNGGLKRIKEALEQ